jgi:hypothetical protein
MTTSILWHLNGADNFAGAVLKERNHHEKKECLKGEGE